MKVERFEKLEAMGKLSNGFNYTIFTLMVIIGGAVVILFDKPSGSGNIVNLEIPGTALMSIGISALVNFVFYSNDSKTAPLKRQKKIRDVFLLNIYLELFKYSLLGNKDKNKWEIAKSQCFNIITDFYYEADSISIKDIEFILENLVSSFLSSGLEKANAEVDKLLSDLKENIKINNKIAYQRLEKLENLYRKIS